jgi:hypothetical protein
MKLFNYIVCFSALLLSFQLHAQQKEELTLEQLQAFAKDN